jgi:lipid A disaccharide synthetase
VGCGRTRLAIILWWGRPTVSFENLSMHNQSIPKFFQKESESNFVQDKKQRQTTNLEAIARYKDQFRLNALNRQQAG